MKLSILLPSIRELACRRVLDNIAQATRAPYEVVVVSPFPVIGPRVIWVKEDTPTGSARAQAVAAKVATGDLLVAMADDRSFVAGWDVLLREQFLKRELRRDRIFCMGLRHVRSRLVGTVFGFYYPYFPVIRRSVGIWYDPIFRANFGDCDLALTVWSTGGACELGPSVLEVDPSDAVRAVPDDYEEEMRKFALRWSPIFGAGWPTAKLRDFNIDVDPDRFLRARHTIESNWPGFARLRAVRGGPSIPALVRRSMRGIGRRLFPA